MTANQREYCCVNCKINPILFSYTYIQKQLILLAQIPFQFIFQQNLLQLHLP